MALVPVQGSLSTTSSPNANINVVTPVVTIPSVDVRLMDEFHVLDTLNSRTALNYDRNAAILDAMAGYVSGSPIVVTMFHRMPNTANGKSADTDIQASLNPADVSYQQIENFEFRLKDSLAYAYDNAHVQSAVTGSGVVYPGYQPSIGDFFLYEIEPGLIGQFKIDKAPTRLSIRSSTCYEIVFSLLDYMDTEAINNIKEMVREVLYFHKRRFLCDNGTLLTTVEYDQLAKLQELKRVLTTVYCDKFYDEDYYGTFMRADGIYDPYVANFVVKVFDTNLFQKFPVKLLAKPDYEKQSIYAKLMDPAAVPWIVYKGRCMTALCQYSVRAVRINSLMNKNFIKLVPTETEHSVTYVTPTDLSVETNTGLTGIDLMLWHYFNDSALDPDIILDYGTNYGSLTDVQQFYHIPIIIFFIQKLIGALDHGLGSI